MFAVPLPESFTDEQQVHALDDAGIDALLTDDPARVRKMLPGWRLDGNAPASGLVRFRRSLDPATRAVVPRAPAK